MESGPNICLISAKLRPCKRPDSGICHKWESFVRRRNASVKRATRFACRFFVCNYSILDETQKQSSCYRFDVTWNVWPKATLRLMTRLSYLVWWLNFKLLKIPWKFADLLNFLKPVIRPAAFARYPAVTRLATLNITHNRLFIRFVPESDFLIFIRCHLRRDHFRPWDWFRPSTGRRSTRRAAVMKLGYF